MKYGTQTDLDLDQMHRRPRTPKVRTRLQIMEIIEIETDTIKSAIDRRNYWKRMLKQLGGEK